MLTIAFPNIDPVAISLGPIAIHWYALAYVAGLVIGWRWCRRLAARSPVPIPASVIDDFLAWATLAVVIGGRLGYVLFYKPSYYAANPLEIVAVWHGGMSFHGGVLGVLVAIVLFCRRRGIGVLAFADVVACAVPIGLFFGRIANFINGELWGRPTDVPWAMVFPTGGPLPRHPSQLYEAALEGLFLFVLLNVLDRRTNLRSRPGALSGVFLIGYATARAFSELFREPDAFLGFMIFGTTMGQLLSIPMLVLGIALLILAFARDRRAVLAPRAESRAGGMKQGEAQS